MQNVHIYEELVALNSISTICNWNNAVHFRKRERRLYTFGARSLGSIFTMIFPLSGLMLQTVNSTSISLPKGISNKRAGDSEMSHYAVIANTYNH